MYGGTCPNVGCVPTKALVHRSRKRRPSDPPQEWYERSVDEVHAITSLFRQGNFDGLAGLPTATVLTGHGEFIDAHTVGVDTADGRIAVRGEHILINTGSTPVVPDIPGLRASKYLVTSTDLIHRRVLPARLAIVGGGYLGIEFAAIYRQFGSDVTMFESGSAILDHEDDDVSAVAESILVDEYLRTSQPHIFALGDVNGGPQFTYVSLDDSRIVLDQLIGAGKRSTADRFAVPRTLFMTPPLANVGLTEKEATRAGHKVKVGRQLVADIIAMPRAYVVEETRGIMKFVIDTQTDEILGAALLSVDAQEIINTVALAMRHGIKATDLMNSIYTHPSTTEAFNDVIGVLVRDDG